MVKSWLNFLGREFGNLHEAALLLATATLLSQFLALARDRLLAGTFGAGSKLDIYYSSFRLPDLIYATIASFISVTVIIPFLIERLEVGEKKKARDFLSAIFTLFLIVMVFVSLVAFIVFPYITPWLMPGFSADQQAELVGLARILLLSPLLLGLSNLLGSVTQTYRKFLIFSLSPVIYNLGIIIGIIFFVPALGLRGLVWGVIIGAFGHLAIQFPTLWRTGFWPRWSPSLIKKEWSAVKKLVLISWPRTLTLSSSQLVIFFLIALASYLGKGSITVFNFALNLQSIPLAIIGVSYSVAAFPTLSRYFAKGQVSDFVRQIETASRHIIFWSLPAIILLIVLRAQIVRVILGFGQFDWTATRLTAACLALFALSVGAQSLVALFVRAYYARGETRKPLLVGLFSSGLIIFLALMFSKLFAMSEPWRIFWENILRVRDLPGAAILMLPLAYTLGLFANFIILLLLFFRDHHCYPQKSLGASLGRSFVGALWGGLVAYILLTPLSLLFDLNTVAGVLGQGLIAGLAGLIVNLLILWIFRSEELADIFRAIHHKFWRGETLVPEQSEL